MNEIVRLVADWLEDGTNGVNALLASVPRDGGDPLPTSVTIYDETRDNRPARGRVPDGATDLPAVTVALRGVTVMAEQVTDDGYCSAEVVVQYAAKNVDAWKAKRDGNYVLRAVAWSLRRLRRLDANAAGRLRNQVALGVIDPIRLEPWVERIEDTLIVGSVVMPVTARDYYAI